MILFSVKLGRGQPNPFLLPPTRLGISSLTQKPGTNREGLQRWRGLLTRQLIFIGFPPICSFTVCYIGGLGRELTPILRQDEKVLPKRWRHLLGTSFN